MGVIPENADLTPRPEEIPSWDRALESPPRTKNGHSSRSSLEEPHNLSQSLYHNAFYYRFELTPSMRPVRVKVVCLLSLCEFVSVQPGITQVENQSSYAGRVVCSGAYWP
jgi:hypothetical protein